MEETPSEINDNQILFSTSEILTCIDCPYIPSLKINTNQHSINVECQNNIKILSQDMKISGHFHNKILLEDYLSKIRNNFENNKKVCSLCQNIINIKNIYYCSFCKAFLCIKCLNDKHLKEKNDHPTLKLDLININCCIHKQIYKYYCRNCFKNICELCLKNKMHKNHELINLEDIKIDDKYLREIEEEINMEENNMKIMNKKFEQYITFIQNKFDNYIQLRKDEINLKRNILYSYEKHKSNYNSIMNVKKIKFDYFKINEDKDKEKKENKNKRDLIKLKNFKKLINELIICEETKLQQKDKEESNNQIDNNLKISLNKEKKEKEKTKVFKENILLKNSKYEIVNKINTKTAEAEQILNLKNNKLLIAYTNRMIIIYEKKYLKNNLEELCSVNLSNSKINTIRSIKNFKGIYQLKNENILISMSGLSNFILKVNYKTKTFAVVQEFMISRGLKINNPLFAQLPDDPQNYNDIIPVIQNNTTNNNNINHNLNLAGAINNNNNHNNIDINNYNTNNRVIIRIRDVVNNNIRNNNNNDNLNENLNINNEIANNNNINRINNIRFIPHGIFQRINNRIGIPINHPLPHNIAYRVNNRMVRRTLTNIVALPNDDLLAMSSKDCWILRNNSIKYVAYKDQIINCDKILMIKKALPISNDEFVVEVAITKHKTYRPNQIANKISKKNNFIYFFFNLNYEEICRKNLNLNETIITYDNDNIYINDLQFLLLMNKKNKEIINIIEIDSLGPIIPIKYNKSFLIQEKGNNAIIEYRIINNEVIRGEQIIENAKAKLIGYDDEFNTLIIQYKNESLLFLQ